MNVVPKPWNELTEDELASLDLRQFLDGRNPYAESDKSLERAFALGKLVMQDIVRERVRFVNGRVLDLLSGAGRWIPFLAAANREVVAIERMEECNRIARDLCKHFAIDNVAFMNGDISMMEQLEDSSFDFVWIWSGLQYVDRAYALTQVRGVLKNGGRVFVGAYNATGLMVEHVLNGAEGGTVFEGSSQWALSALARGPGSDGNPNFADLEGCAQLCDAFGLSLLASAPQLFLDLRAPEGRAVDWQKAPRMGRYFRTIEFLAERSVNPGKAEARMRSMGFASRGLLRRWIKR